MEFINYNVDYDFVVTGGGFTGVCCAIMAAREGLKTALITNRGFIGGNSGAEVRCPVDGADGEQQYNFSSRETGLIEEIRLKNMYVNRDGNPYRWDMVIMDFIAAEKNLTLYLNTCIDRVETENGRVTEISGIQVTSEKRYTFRAPLFADNTGDGTIAALAGCEYHMGSEGRESYDEKIAPEKQNSDVLLGTLTYTAKDYGHKIEFTAPDNAFDMERSGCLEAREIPKEMFERFVWFYETGYGLDQVSKAEENAEAHRELLYSIWDHIKKHPETYGADNYDFEFVSPFVGKRESRRIEGMYRLTEQDLYYQKDFPDAAGYGGWAIDLHSPKGFFGKDPENWWVYLPGMYQIPLSCAIAKDVNNLFVIGRCFSVSHVALGSVRVNATLATVGQAVGIAAAICCEKNIDLHKIGKEEIKELHRRQWKEDQTVIGYKNEDEKDLALSAKVQVSSVKPFVLSDIATYYPCDRVYGQSMPVNGKVEKITFKYKLEGKKPAGLHVSVYRSEKPQNYGPEILLSEHEYMLTPTGKDPEITGEEPGITGKESGTFDIELSGLGLSEEFIFIKFDGHDNSKLLLASGTDRLPGVAALMRQPNLIPNMVDYETLSPLPFEWMKLGVPLELRKYSTAAQPNKNYAFCFAYTPSFNPYEGENMINGYFRPYKKPNLWVSDGLKDEWAEFSFDGEKTLQSLYITFDSGLNFRIRNLKPYDFNVMPEVTKDFEVWAHTAEGDVLAAKVEGNYQRQCRMELNGIKADRLTIKILSTNGCPDAGIYSVSIY